MRRDMIRETPLLNLSTNQMTWTRIVSDHRINQINPACCFEFNIVGANTSMPSETFVIANKPKCV